VAAALVPSASACGLALVTDGTPPRGTGFPGGLAQGTAGESGALPAEQSGQALMAR